MSNTSPCDPSVAWKTPLLYNDNPTNYPFGLAISNPGQIDTPGAIRQDVDPAGLGTRTFVFAMVANSANITTGDVVLFLKPTVVANIPANIIPQGTVIANTAAVTSNLSNTAGANTTGTQQDLVAGVAIGNVTVGNFGWFQKTGQHPAVVTTGTVNAGDLLIMSTTANEAAALTANVTAGSGAAVQYLGRAIAANTANATTAVILGLPNF